MKDRWGGTGRLRHGLAAPTAPLKDSGTKNAGQGCKTVRQSY
jgi:hypothetical protein